MCISGCWTSASQGIKILGLRRLQKDTSKYRIVRYIIVVKWMYRAIASSWYTIQ